MSGKDRPGRAAHRRVLALEVLETRALFSVMPLLLTAGRGPQKGNGSSIVDTFAGQGASGGSSGVSATAVTGQPTPHELARQRFVAKLSGTYITGPGQFTNQSLQAFFLATGGSNQSFHMNLQMKFFMSKDPTQPTVGIVALSDKNVGSSGNTLILDLTAAPQTGFRGLPTQFNWTVDPSSGGLWSNANFMSEGTNFGTLTIHYMPGGRLPQRATGGGRADLVFNGLIYTTGVTLDLGAPGNRPKNP